MIGISRNWLKTLSHTSSVFISASSTPCSRCRDVAKISGASGFGTDFLVASALAVAMEIAGCPERASEDD